MNMVTKCKVKSNIGGQQTGRVVKSHCFIYSHQHAFFFFFKNEILNRN